MMICLRYKPCEKQTNNKDKTDRQTKTSEQQTLKQLPREGQEHAMQAPGQHKVKVNVVSAWDFGESQEHARQAPGSHRNKSRKMGKDGRGEVMARGTQGEHQDGTGGSMLQVDTRIDRPLEQQQNNVNTNKQTNKTKPSNIKDM
jgi:hypothetical protein